jgi:hypothetical protein
MKAGVATCGVISQKIEFFTVEYIVYLFISGLFNSAIRNRDCIV